MEIDPRFPTKLSTVSDAPEPLRSALAASLPSGESTRLLVHAPAFATGDEKTPATVLAVTNNSWLVASETEGDGAAVEKSKFSDTLYLELKSILLLGQLRICFAAVDKSYSVTIRFETVEDHFYREAIDLILAGIDPALTGTVEQGQSEASMFEGWPMKIRNEAQRLLAQGATVSRRYSVAGCFRRNPGTTCSGRRTVSHRARACGDLGGERILNRTPSGNTYILSLHWETRFIPYLLRQLQSDTRSSPSFPSSRFQKSRK
jgi:hypothetical protein